MIYSLQGLLLHTLDHLAEEWGNDPRDENRDVFLRLIAMFDDDTRDIWERLAALNAVSDLGQHAEIANNWQTFFDNGYASLPAESESRMAGPWLSAEAPAITKALAILEDQSQTDLPSEFYESCAQTDALGFLGTVGQVGDEKIIAAVKKSIMLGKPATSHHDQIRIEMLSVVLLRGTLTNRYATALWALRQVLPKGPNGQMEAKQMDAELITQVARLTRSVNSTRTSASAIASGSSCRSSIMRQRAFAILGELGLCADRDLADAQMAAVMDGLGATDPNVFLTSRFSRGSSDSDVRISSFPHYTV